VGALRAGYWYRQLPDAMNCHVSVITAQENASGSKVFVVPLLGSSVKNVFIKDEGVVWKRNIKNYLENHTSIVPDIVIITGGPFMHFSLGNWFQHKFNSKVILDYRDPFANNPRFRNSWFKKTVKGFFEKKFNRHADAILTVNNYCAQLINGFDKKPHAIIQNGYDETVKITPHNIDVNKELKFIYAGKFYFDPGNMLKAFIEKEVNFTYLGPDDFMLPLNSKNISSKGFVTYDQSMQFIASSDVGIILIHGKKFESTSKIFDYIYSKRIILIITNGTIKSGSIHDELKYFPNVYWAENTKESIIKGIENIKKSTYVVPQVALIHKYSRKHQMERLMSLIRTFL
jgi:hypothetical protein